MLGFALAANAIVLLIGLAAAELGLRWYVEGGVGPAIASILGSRSPASYLGTDNWLVHDDEIGFKLNPQRDGVNSLGIRNAEVAPDKPADVFRLLVVGDSIAWPTDGFVSLLHDRISGLREGPIEIINAAVPGYTTFQERRLLERDLLVLQPDLVVLEYCLNDNHDQLHRLTADGKWLITQEAKEALLTQGDGVLARLSSSSYLLLEIRRRLYARRAQSPGEFPWQGREDFFVAWEDGPWLQFEEHLLSMKNSLGAIGAALMVLAVPYEPQLREDLLALDQEYTLKPQRQLARITADAALPFLDLFPAFSESRDLDVYENDGIHLEPAGHELVAQQLVRFLELERLIAPR